MEGADHSPLDLAFLKPGFFVPDSVLQALSPHDSASRGIPCPSLPPGRIRPCSPAHHSHQTPAVVCFAIISTRVSAVLAVLRVGAVNVRFRVPGTKCVVDARKPAAWANVEERGVQGNSRFGVSGGWGGAVSVERKVGARLGRPCVWGLDFCTLPRKCSGSLCSISDLKDRITPGWLRSVCPLCPPPPPRTLRAGTMSVLSSLYPRGLARLFLAIVDT